MDNRGKFSQPAGIYSLITDNRLFVLVPSARFTICHLEYHANVGFAKCGRVIFFTRESISKVDEITAIGPDDQKRLIN
ncbi:hypothetical protein A3849_30860 [Paenibacillus sp. P46E]|nr:hypothetical protein A3849_30860 [Paenibacillus sp. P46E]